MDIAAPDHVSQVLFIDRDGAGRAYLDGVVSALQSLPNSVVVQNGRRYELHEHATDDRDEVQEFIKQRFMQSFASDVRSFMPRLFSLRDDEQRLCGAFGLRNGREPLFLERYLDEPIEHWPARLGCKPWQRSQIAEVGHLAVNFPGGARTLIRMLTLLLTLEGIEGIAFTGTTSLRNAFRRMHLEPLAVALASVDRLPENEQASWGTYYRKVPQVYIGDVSRGYRTLMERGAERV